MWFSVITLFPDMLNALKSGVTGRALTKQLIHFEPINPRDFASDARKTIDDTLYGGGPGMLMMAPPLLAAIESAKLSAKEFNASASPKVLYLSPQGKPFNQAAAERLSQESSLILIAGRYEGIDERVIDLAVDEEWSVGDYILSGGELPAMIMIDCIARLIPGVIGDQESVTSDSFSADLLKYPQFTKPYNYQGHVVPQTLIQGHHAEIRRWRLQQALGRTWLRRPDLLAKKTLTSEETTLLNQFIEDFSQSNLEK